MDRVTKILEPIAGNPLQGLRRADHLWSSWREGNRPIPTIVTLAQENFRDYDCDVVVCGGTLGILLATALQHRGWRVIVLEKGVLQGRIQEWNISREELQILFDLELLRPAELRDVLVTEYNPARVQFHGGEPLWVENVLNVGVSPRALIEILKDRFLSWGGKIFECNACTEIQVSPGGAIAKTEKLTLKTRLIVDAMGHFSPIAQQARRSAKPDGICLVVGSCAGGYLENTKGDLIYSFTPIRNQCQYFWEAFPARDGRTTYLFTYLDAHPQRFSLEFFMEEYLKLLPEYQQTELESLDFRRFLFGFFPSYRRSPTRYPWDRLIPVGDSSGVQSPVSFGGFGAMLRHLERLTRGIDDALKQDCCDQRSLSRLQPYQPNLSVTWLFQKAMSVGVNQTCPPNRINDLLNAVFSVMSELGDDVLKPFLKDVVQFEGLAKTLPRVNPKTVFPLLPRLGAHSLADWTRHFVSLGMYSLGFHLTKKLPQTQQYHYARLLEALKYGSGNDYRKEDKDLSE